MDLQRDADFSKVKIIFVQDGEENAFSSEHFENRPYTVEQITIPHGGVSAARNAGLKASTAEWVMFCDCDDMFANVYALRDILNVLPAPNFDMLWMEYYSEDKMANGEMRLGKRGLNVRDLVHIHGKLYRRQFLLDNDLWFDPSLKFNEDSCFNAIATNLVDNQRTGTINTIDTAYIWCFREGSATTSQENIGIAILGLYQRNKAVCDVFRRQLDYKRYCGMVARTIWDTYHSLNVDEFTPELQEIYDDFKKWYPPRKKCWLFVDKDTMNQVKKISQDEHIWREEEAESRWGIHKNSHFRENISIDEWLKQFD